jgi:shikimate dehydrogenase
MTGGDRMFFLGVSTSGSSIMKLFPIWCELLDLEATMEGRDLPIGAEPAVYRDAVQEIAGRPDVLGALVTTHKVDVFRHALDSFDEVDDNARLCREVSSISKRDGFLWAHAKDPISAGKSLGRIVGAGPPPRHVLCLGAGGAGTAISVFLLRHPNRPARVVMVDRDPSRIERVRAIHDDLGAPTEVDYRLHGHPTSNDELLAGFPAGCLVINATGMGKDVPGSPLTDAARFPEGAVVWELNYRGDLTFLEQAQRQAERKGIAVHDGWDYFLYGWSEVIAEVFHLQIDDTCFEELRGAAEALRP